MSAKVIALRELVESVKTWNPSKSSPDSVFQYVDLSAVDQDSKQISDARPMRCADAPSRARQLLQAGDVLVSTVRPNLNGVARVPSQLDSATASTGFCVLRPRRTVLDSSYLFQWVQSPTFVDGMVKQATGASYPAVSDRIILTSELPLPPLPEQQRIAKILDAAEALRAKRRAAIAELDALGPSIFMEMFVASAAFPSEALESVCDLITDGTHYTPTYAEAGVVFLSARNVTSGYITWDDVKFIPESLHQELTKRVSPRRQDVLLAKNGTTGVAAIVDRDCVFDIYVSLALLRPSKLILPIYLHQAINSPACKRQFNAALKGIGVSNLHLVDIRQTRIPIPPLALQREFATRIATLEKAKSAQRASLAELDALFTALQHRAFRGEL